jgi:hypothetical protein
VARPSGLSRAPRGRNRRPRRPSWRPGSVGRYGGAGDAESAREEGFLRPTSTGRRHRLGTLEFGVGFGKLEGNSCSSAMWAGASSHVTWPRDRVR